MSQEGDDDHKDQEIEQHEIVEVHAAQDDLTWFQKMTCRGRMNKEQELITTPKAEEKEEQKSPPPEGEEAPGCTKSCTDKLTVYTDEVKGYKDEFVVWSDVYLLKLTSLVMLVMCYGAFLSNLLMAYYTYMVVPSAYFNYIIAIMGVNHFIRTCFWLSMEEEWILQLPYIELQSHNGYRLFAIRLAIILNLDTFYWVYLMYITENRRDGEIEYIMALSRSVQVLLEYIPLMYIATFIVLQDPNFNKFVFPALAYNLAQTIVMQYTINFLNGNTYDAIQWCFLRSLELWSKASIFCFALTLFQDKEVFLGIFLVSIFLMCLLWFTFLTDFSKESIIGGLVTYFIIVAKTVAIFSFKEANYGYTNKFDSEAQPSMYEVKIQKKTNVGLSYAVNFGFYLQVGYICLLAGGQDVIMAAGPNFKLMMATGLGSFGILSLYYCYFLSYFVKANTKQDQD